MTPPLVASAPPPDHRPSLLDSEESFLHLMNGVTDYAIYFLDADGNIASWNNGAERLKGYTAEEIVGRHVSVFFIEEDIAAGKPQLELERAAAEGRFEQEAWRVRKDGSRFWANMVISARRDHEGQLRGFAKVTRDVSARRAIDEKLRAYTTKLEQSNRELESFASIASHDLQEPLRKIRAFGDLLVSRYGERLEPDARDYLERMRAAAARMQDLIENLLAFSRVATKTKAFTNVDLTKVAQEVSVDLEERVHMTKGRLEIASLPSIEADPMQMRQLFQNLFANALKFHRTDVPPVVRVSARAVPATSPGGAGSTEIRVDDNGIGFDPKYAERIFGIFQRLHGRTEYDGTGIGLAICRRIVERHGGTIVAASKPGEGASFTVTLPNRQPRLEAAPS